MMIIVKPSSDILQLNKGFRFERNSTAFDEEGNLYLPHNARFQQGKFGKAIMVEEGTTNLNSDPFFKTGVSGWGKGSWTTLEWLSSEYNPFSKQNGVMRLYDNDGTNRLCLKVVSISNTPHTVSVLLKILKGNINRINVGGTINYTDSTYTDYTWNNSNTTRYDMSAIFGQGVYKLVATITPNSSKTIRNYQIRISHNDAVETELFVYAVQLEPKPYNTSFIDGTRSPEIVTIPVNTISPTGGQWDHYVYVNDMARRQVAGQTPTLFHIPRQDGGMGIRVCHAEDTANWKLQTMDDTNNITEAEAPDTLTPDGWHRFTVKWTEAEAKLLIDGVVAGTIANPALPSVFASEAYIGSYDGQKDFLNTLHDDIRVSSIARTDADDLADYQADQPLPTDQYTIYKQSFDSPNDMYVRQGLVL